LKLPTLLLLLGALSAPVLAQGDARPFVEGTVAFEAVQFPFGPYSQSFQAEGPALPPGGNPGAGAAVGGFLAAAEDTTTALLYSARTDTDGTVDLCALLLRRPGSGDALSIPAGDYPVDLGGSCLFAFADGVRDFVLPVEFTPAAVMAWAESLDADRVFVSVTGALHVDVCDVHQFSGTFGGSLLDESFTTIALSGGTFDATGTGVANEVRAWGDVKSLWR
jgi:hypothetical protein